MTQSLHLHLGLAPNQGDSEEESEDDDKVILPTASGVSNEGGSSPLLVPLPAVSWPWVPAWGPLEPPRRDGENAQKTGIFGEKMGEIRPKKCEPRELTKEISTARLCYNDRQNPVMLELWKVTIAIIKSN